MSINRFLDLDTKSTTKREFFLTLFFLYLFAIFVRVAWTLSLPNSEQFIFNNTYLLTNSDGYFSATGARDLIAGFNQHFDDSPVCTLISQFTALVGVVLPFSLETIIFYLPAIVGSFVIVPIMLTFRLLKLEHLGILASIFASVSYAYFARTSAGYYDTDMLAITLPLMIMYALIGYIQTKQTKYIAYGFVFGLLSYLWYPQSVAVILAILGFGFLYIIAYEKDKFDSQKIFIFILIGLLNIAIYLKIALFFAIFYILPRLDIIKYYLLMFVIVFLFFYFGSFDYLLMKLQTYFFKVDAIADTKDDLHLHFYSLLKTVEESQNLDLIAFANDISGGVYIFIASVFGYILMISRYKILSILFAFVVLGLLSFKTGNRFSMYASPVFAISLAYVVLISVQNLQAKLQLKPIISKLILVFVVFLLLVPQIKHINSIHQAPALTPLQASSLAQIGKLKNSPEDYMIGWWDNGYFFNYFADTKILTSGGKNYGSDNFPVAYSYIKNQKISSRFLRLNIELLEDNFHKEYLEKPFIKGLIKHYKYDNAKAFLSDFEADKISIPKPTRDIYIYFPSNLSLIMPNILKFVSQDIDSGKTNEPPLFYMSKKFIVNGDKLILGNNYMTIDIKKGTLLQGDYEIPLHKFVILETKNGKLKKQISRINKSSPFCVIFDKVHKEYFVVDTEFYYSTYVQLGLLENYDKRYYEPAVLNKDVKIYKIRD